MWRHVCALSQHSYQRIFDRLGVKVQNRPESSYIRDFGPVLAELEKRGFITKSKERIASLYLLSFRL